MGRAFSVFMFCAAMDPVYWALNRIPRALGVEGYVDDCSVAGELPRRDSHSTLCLSWLRAVRDIYDGVASAGFLVLDHTCFWSQCFPSDGISVATLSSAVVPASAGDTPRLCWPSLWAAAQHGISNVDTGQVILLGRGSQWVALTPPLARDLVAGCFGPWVFPLLTSPCRCKAKTALFVNVPLSSSCLLELDRVGYGAHSVTSQDTQLGLQLLGRFGLTPEGWVRTPRMRPWFRPLSRPSYHPESPCGSANGQSVSSG